MFRNYHIEQVATGFTFSERHVVRSAIEITFPSVCLSVCLSVGSCEYIDWQRILLRNLFTPPGRPGISFGCEKTA